MTSDRAKALFIDLGKPTLRGVRKCPKCGTFNGTRGLSCKNKECDAVFREQMVNSKKQPDCVKLTTDATTLLYSVRQRDRGPDWRGFVELFTVIYESTEASGSSGLTASAARCYCESCGNFSLSSTSDSMFISRDCPHSLAAVACTTNAQPLVVRPAVIDLIPGLTDEGRDSLQQLISDQTLFGPSCEITGNESSEILVHPIVQRVTRFVFVVKSPPPLQPQQPQCETPGYQHVTFSDSTRQKQSTHCKFHCSCWTVTRDKMPVDTTNMNCIHFYACICAFMSDEKLSLEFETYIALCTRVAKTDLTVGENNLFYLNDAFCAVDTAAVKSSTFQDEQMLDINGQSVIISTSDTAADGNQLLSTISDGGSQGNDEVDPTGAIFELIVDGSDTAVDVDLEDPPPDLPTGLVPPVVVVPSTGPVPVSGQHPVKQLKLSSCGSAADNTAGYTFHSTIAEAIQQHSRLTCRKAAISAEESHVQLTFEDWLASVTERINQTMHYQFSGNPDPLVFHVPNKFFSCLQQRMSVGTAGRKKRLPNTAQQFSRTDSPPLGNFVKYTWALTNIAHIKQIFDTPQRSLEVCRRFIENRDGTFSPFECPATDVAHTYTGKQQPIRPAELKTFIKIGGECSGLRDASPFIIEWIPDLLPESHVGEMRINFQYGHQRNGAIEHRNNRTATSAATSAATAAMTSLL